MWGGDVKEVGMEGVAVLAMCFRYLTSLYRSTMSCRVERLDLV